MAVEHDAQRPLVEAVQPHGQQGIVAERRADPDHDRVVRRAHDLHAEVGDLAGDGEARIVLVAAPRNRPPCSASLSVTIGRPSVDAQDMAEMVAPRRRPRRAPTRDRDPRLAQQRVALRPATRGSGSSHRADDAARRRRR